MSSSSTQNFTGISSCVGSFNNPGCITKTIQFTISSILFLISLSLLYHYIRFFGFKGKLYINLALGFMSLYLLVNMIFCFWNSIFELYSVQTYFNNLYFLSIVIFTTRSYLIKPSVKKVSLTISRLSDESNNSTQQAQQSYCKKLSNFTKTAKFYKLLYKSMALIFFILFTLIMITSLVGDIEASKTINTINNQNEDNAMFSFLKDSCEEVWYLVINAICVLLSLIVLVVLYMNYQYEQQRITNMTLLTFNDQKPSPFLKRSNSFNFSYKNTAKNVISPKKMNNPLKKLAIWIGINILGSIINLVQSGLLIKADPLDRCQIIKESTNQNSILMLIFVILTVYIQYASSLWFFYDIMIKKTKFQVKNQQPLIQSHEYSQQIRVGHIQMNPSLSKKSSSDQN